MSDFEAAEFDDELLSAYLDDELTPEERARVEERLAADPRARQLLEELRAVSRAMKELPPATLGTDLRETVLRRAERAMLVSGERASAGGLNEVARRIPFGRSKRAWFWAGATLAAGLMLMVFAREPGRNQDLTGEVARLKSPAPRGDSPVPELRSSDRAKDEAGDVVASVPTTAPAASPPATVSVPGEMASREVASGGAGGAVAVRSAPTVANVPAEELLVVHVNVTPAAFKNRAFDALFSKHQIEVEEPAADEAKVAEPSDVEMVLVEAAPAQVDACLAELDADHDNYLGIAVDEEFAANQQAPAGKQLANDLKQHNRGELPRQQKVELGPNNRFYYQSNRSLLEVDRQLADKSEAPQRLFRQDAPGADNRGRALRVEPQSTALGYAADEESAATPAAENSFGEARQNFARRAVQKLATKADLLQVLFVLTAGDEPAAANPAAAPASLPPAEEGLKIDEQ